MNTKTKWILFGVLFVLGSVWVISLFANAGIRYAVISAYQAELLGKAAKASLSEDFHFTAEEEASTQVQTEVDYGEGFTDVTVCAWPHIEGRETKPETLRCGTERIERDHPSFDDIADANLRAARKIERIVFVTRRK